MTVGNRRLAVGLTVISCGVLLGVVGVSVAIASGFGESTTCSSREGRAIFERAGLPAGELTAVQGCTEEHRFLREGEWRTAVGTAKRERVLELLEQGAVDRQRASPYDGYRRGVPMDVVATPRDREWRDGESLSYRDAVDIDGYEWDRYVEWGKARNGDEYMLMVIIEAENM